MAEQLAEYSEYSPGPREAGLTTAEILRLLGAGASGAILMALGEGSLRTKELTGRVGGYTSRTVYRYASKLTEVGLIERYEESGVPSKVVHSLSRPAGQELYDLMEAYAEASLSRLPNGEIDAHAWGSLGLLADLWESGMIADLNLGPRSMTELDKGRHNLSYHQVSRRVSLFAIGGFLEERSVDGRRRCYVLTGKARRAMALIAGIGRWRRRHVVGAGMGGLRAEEGAEAVRTALPLIALPEHCGKSLEMKVEEEAVWAQVEPGGAVLSCASPPAEVNGRALADVKAWIDALLDGPNGGLRAEGDRDLIETCVSRLHAELWRSGVDQGPHPAAASASAAPGR